jgi:hypothetical protein
MKQENVWSTPVSCKDILHTKITHIFWFHQTYLQIKQMIHSFPEMSSVNFFLVKHIKVTSLFWLIESENRFHLRMIYTTNASPHLNQRRVFWFSDVSFILRRMDGPAATRIVYVFGWFWFRTISFLFLIFFFLLSAISSSILHGKPVMQVEALFLLLLCPPDFVDLWDGRNFFWMNNEWFCQTSWCWARLKICILKYYKRKLSPYICLGWSFWLQSGRSTVLVSIYLVINEKESCASEYVGNCFYSQCP